MLERFTEKARRVIFFARYEASQYGSPYIESFHILLGLAREDSLKFRRLGAPADRMRRIYEALFTARPTISTSVEVPLSKESKRVLNRAGEEAEKLGIKHVGTEHILLAILAESPQIRTEMEKLGVTDDDVRKVTRMEPIEPLMDPQDYEVMSEYTGRTGIGYDLHRLETGRKLTIGGVEVPFDKGPVGHSDGDVLAHAICDALLGAAGMGDIGTHFPDTDPKWKGANSLIFLEHLRDLFEKRDLQIIHIDAVVIAERPKLGSHFPAMREALAKALGIETDQINLKAKTNEGVDAIGRGEAIAAHVVATITG
jgi:2-C-methyl-D-erythritol 2,4-cyclodiphosphate synthase